MAIEKMQKLRIVTHDSYFESVMDLLQRLGTVETSNAHSEEIEPRRLAEGEVHEIRNLNLKISQIDFVIDFLKEHSRKKLPFIKSLIKDKYVLSVDEFMAFNETVDIASIYDEASKLEGELLRLLELKSRLTEELRELECWEKLEIPLKRLEGGRYHRVLCGRFPAALFEKARDQIEELIPESALEVIGTGETLVRVVIVCHVDSMDELERILSEAKFEPVSLANVPAKAAERISEIMREVERAESEVEGVKDRIDELWDEVPSLEILREYCINKRRKIESGEITGKTDKTTVIEGWVPAREVQRLRERIASVTEEMEVEVSDPGPDDDPPILLRNPRIMKPFELLTGLYGLPHNREYDPTPIVAVSFTVFFGFCIGDVGYGAALILAFYLMKRFLPIGKRVRDLFTVMSWGSAFAIVMGVLTGSWFGIETAKLPGILRNAAIFKPLTEPLPVMGVCMALGLLHMVSGTVVELRDNWRSGDRAAALIDQGLVLAMFAAGGLAAFLIALKVMSAKSAILLPLAVVTGMLFLLGRSSESIAGKVVNGLYETYNTVVGWLGDTVSYMRLFALGLATFVIGWVVNTLGGMVSGMLPVLGFLVMLVILIVGHVFNVAINLLGAFVHPLRLQFVEFFGKFYEDGGKEFKPLKIDSKIVMIREDEDE